MANEQTELKETAGMPSAVPVQTPYPGQVGIYGTVAEAKRPLLVMGTRYEYMMDHLPNYKMFIRYRVYAILSAIVGAWLLLNMNLLALPAFFLATYYYQLVKLKRAVTVENKRTVMIGH
ncbi:MAG: hypothetical protein QXR53_00745 [Candidatus Norongarragalinales archaeon]